MAYHWTRSDRTRKTLQTGDGGGRSGPLKERIRQQKITKDDAASNQSLLFETVRKNNEGKAIDQDWEDDLWIYFGLDSDRVNVSQDDRIKHASTSGRVKRSINRARRKT